MSTSSSNSTPIFFHGLRKGETFGDTGSSFEITLRRVGSIEKSSSAFEDVTTLRIHPHEKYFSSGFFSIVGLPSEFCEYWKPVALETESISQTHTVSSIDHASWDGQPHKLHVLLTSLGQPSRNREVKHRGQTIMKEVAEDVLYTLRFDQRDPKRMTLEPVIQAPQPYKSLTNDDNDVSFIFPFEKSSCNGVLWASKANLRALSSYFESIFTWGFTESDNILLETSQMLNAVKKDLFKVKAEERKKGRPTDALHSDSDIEDDDDSMQQDNDEAEQETEQSSVSSAIHYITIRGTSYKTYEGLLGWAYSGKIEYAPLKSTHPTSSSTKPSPKSIFRLAHQLGIKVLEDDAVANFKSQLNHKNVLEELFSSTCFAYPVLRDAGLKVLERDWAKVKESGGLDGISKLLESDQGDSKEMTRMALEILKRAPKLGC